MTHNQVTQIAYGELYHKPTGRPAVIGFIEYFQTINAHLTCVISSNMVVKYP